MKFPSARCKPASSIEYSRGIRWEPPGKASTKWTNAPATDQPNCSTTALSRSNSPITRVNLAMCFGGCSTGIAKPLFLETGLTVRAALGVTSFRRLMEPGGSVFCSPNLTRLSSLRVRRALQVDTPARHWSCTGAGRLQKGCESVKATMDCPWWLNAEASVIRASLSERMIKAARPCPGKARA